MIENTNAIDSLTMCYNIVIHTFSPRCRYHQVLVGATSWRFKSSYPHHKWSPEDGAP